MLVPWNLSRARLQVLAHAKEFDFREVCGIIIDGEVVRSKNVASGTVEMPDGTVRDCTPLTDFKLDDESFAAWEQAIAQRKSVVVYHSHVGDERDFTRADVEGMYSTQCPWMLVHTPSEGFQYFDPTAELDYEDREWHWAYSNCSTLVRDWLKREMDFNLEIPIPDHEGVWRTPGWNDMIVYADRQLERLPRDFTALRRGDVIVMLVDGETRSPEHVGVIVDSVRNELLHHLVDQLSRVRVFTPAYQKATYQMYRIPNA